MSSVQSLYESWSKISRDLYVHKLVKSNKTVDKELIELKNKGIIKDLSDVYIYSFIHPDTNQVMSFTGGNVLMPGITSELFISYLSPTRVVAYKGGNVSQEFSGEKISADRFITSSYLFSGQKTEFKKIASLPIDVMSTTVPIPLPLSIVMYEKFEIDIEKNKFKINYIEMKRFKAWSLPQMLSKSNYLFTYKCKVK